MIYIQVDFNAMDEQGRVRLSLPCCQRSLERVVLKEEDLVTLEDEEFSVQAMIVFVEGVPMAVPDWDTERERL